MFSETDLTEDLKKIDVPTLFLHGDDDQIVPFANSAAKATKLVGGSTLKVYPGAGHSLPQTQQDGVNADLLAFVSGLNRSGDAGSEKIEMTLAPAH